MKKLKQILRKLIEKITVMPVKIENIMLSPHFSLREFIFSQTAIRNGINNIPDSSSIINMKLLCNHLLEPLRSIINSPIIISSGYRSFELNEAVGGRRFSQHCFGKAADILVRDIHPKQLFNIIIQSTLPYDKIILEFNAWIHISYSEHKNRQIKLIASRINESLIEYRSLS